MSAAKIEVITHQQWGQCVSLRNAHAELLVTLDFGPRIIHLSTPGGSNLFMEDADRQIMLPGEDFEPNLGNWYIYGGHRLWTSPEICPRTSYPDNGPVSWEAVGERGIVVRPPQERWNQISKEIEISLAESGEITVEHRVTNDGPWPITFAPWALSVMSAGGRAVVPMTAPDSGFLPNRRFVLWPYSRLNDSRAVFTETAIVVNQGEGPTPFKFGSDNAEGWAAYSNHGDTFVKRYSPVADGKYPDFGVSFELYVNDLMLELETLGELRETAPGETVEHTETWSIVKGLDLRGVSEDQAVRVIREIVG